MILLIKRYIIHHSQMQREEVLWPTHGVLSERAYRVVHERVLLESHQHFGPATSPRTKPFTRAGFFNIYY